MKVVFLILIVFNLCLASTTVAMVNFPHNASDMINIPLHSRIFPLNLIELNKTAHPEMDMEPYQNYIIIAMTSSNVAVGLMYRILLCRSFLEQGLSPINFLIGNLYCGIIMMCTVYFILRSCQNLSS